MNTAIIVAAGVGKRFGGDTPKQFLTLRGKSLLGMAISAFQDCEDIDEIVLVVSADRLEAVSGFKNEFSKLVSIVAGGKTRSESVLRGLNSVSLPGIVAVHDGARPFVAADEISRTIMAAVNDGAACLVIPVTDTIKRVDGDRIVETLDRSKLRRAVTPQCFRTELLIKAFELAGTDLNDTDESSMIEKLGEPVMLVEGSPANIKITTPEDLEIAAAIMD